MRIRFDNHLDTHEYPKEILVKNWEVRAMVLAMVRGPNFLFLSWQLAARIRAFGPDLEVDVFRMLYLEDRLDWRDVL